MIKPQCYASGAYGGLSWSRAFLPICRPLDLYKVLEKGQIRIARVSMVIDEVWAKRAGRERGMTVQEEDRKARSQRHWTSFQARDLDNRVAFNTLLTNMSGWLRFGC